MSEKPKSCAGQEKPSDDNKQIINRFGDKQKFLETFNPSYQKLIALHQDRVFTGQAPTLAKMQQVYSYQLYEVWVMAQLEHINSFCGVKQKMDLSQMETLATIIFTEYYYLKFTELMLFFHQFKAGKYGAFYGTVDPQKITVALLEFVKERFVKLQELERKAQKEIMDKKRQEWQQTGITRAEYEKIKEKENPPL